MRLPKAGANWKTASSETVLIEMAESTSPSAILEREFFGRRCFGIKWHVTIVDFQDHGGEGSQA